MLHCAKTRRMYMFALHKPGEERVSERSETVALLSVLSGVHVGIVSKE